MTKSDGVLDRVSAIDAVCSRVLARTVRNGDLVRMLPNVYLDPARSQEVELKIRAALLHGGERVAISHSTALLIWGLPAPHSGPVHVLTDADHRLRGYPQLRTHRRPGFESGPPHVVWRRGIPVTNLDRTLIDAWTILGGEAQRAPVVLAISQRMTTPQRLLDLISKIPTFRSRAGMSSLVRKLAAGCRSELEIWGYDTVFSGNEWSDLERQVPFKVEGRTIYLDIYARRERVNFELDGAKYHSSRADRERDLRRDAALAAQGVLVVRFTHNRLLTEPSSVRRQARQILQARRQSYR